MLQVNNEQQRLGVYSPVRHVTGIFDNAESLFTILQELNTAGFSDDEIEVFVGEDGADKLDLQGRKVGAVARMFRTLELSLTDETEIHELLDETLRNGGMTVNVHTAGEDDRKAQAARILKLYDPKDLRYWGHWSIERL